MARVVIEGFPDELLQQLKIRAVREKTSVKALMIEAAREFLHPKPPMSPEDKAHFIIRARREGMPAAEIAKALGMNADSMAGFLAKRQTQRAKDAVGKVGQELPPGVES